MYSLLFAVVKENEKSFFDYRFLFFQKNFFPLTTETKI